jgi:hypothetical protein
MKAHDKLTLGLFLILLASASSAQDNQTRVFWKLSGDHAITWNLTTETILPHSDNIEMSGQKVAAIISYEVDENKKLKLSRDVIFPQLRHFIESSANDWRYYRAYLRDEYNDEFLPTIIVDEKTFEPGPLDSVRIDGMLKFYHSGSQGLTIERVLAPSLNGRLFVEIWRMRNTANSPIIIELGKSEFLQVQRGQNGLFTRKVFCDAQGTVVLEPQKVFEFAVYFSARLDDEPSIFPSYHQVLLEREGFLDTVSQHLILETPDPVLNRLFAFSKIRASESIYDTKMGLVHSPGGGRYYTGVWANDQAEYSGPFFPFLGYETGNIAAMNAYRQFLNNIPEGDGNFWSSFEMEGTVTCCGGDRGDAAMIAFGASQYALFSGSKAKAEELWPLIEWSLEYCERKKNKAGVISSDSDEMEGRIATGGANLATSSLTYGALKQTALLAKAMGMKKSTVKKYEKRAADLHQSIEAYFGATIEGLDTYQYFQGHPYLRHWICLPLVMGINDRKDGTLDALFNNLWTDNGVKVAHNPESEEPNLFWDRGTLYAFRGAFKAGAANRALEKLHAYSATRLLGFHVPYVVEAWPEGNMAHLSAESALYCRIFTEGILGIVPTGFKSFELTPNIPKAWAYFNLKKIRAFGSEFDVLIERDEDKLDVQVVRKGETILQKLIKNGETILVTL